MGCGAAAPDGDEHTPPCAIADLRAVRPRGVAPDKGRCFTPFSVGIGAIEHALEADSDPIRAIPTAPRAFAGSRTCSRRALRYRPVWSRYLQGAFTCVKFRN